MRDTSRPEALLRVFSVPCVEILPRADAQSPSSTVTGASLNRLYLVSVTRAPVHFARSAARSTSWPRRYTAAIRRVLLMSSSGFAWRTMKSALLPTVTVPRRSSLRNWHIATQSLQPSTQVGTLPCVWTPERLRHRQARHSGGRARRRRRSVHFTKRCVSQSAIAIVGMTNKTVSISFPTPLCRPSGAAGHDVGRLGRRELRPRNHQLAPPVEQVSAVIRGFGFVSERVRERGFADGPRDVRLLRRPIPEGSPEAWLTRRP